MALARSIVTRGLVVSIAVAGVSRSAHAAEPYCNGEYAEDLDVLSPHARDQDAHGAPFSYAVRTSATYECVSYGSDGNLVRSKQTTTAYGTAFGYRRDGSDTLLLTNEHVAEWPSVTDTAHPVDGVPSGCKRVADALKIVDDDHDDYAGDDIALTRVVADPVLDIAVLRAHVALEIMPWRVGKSSALAARDIVEVRGFPLGEFRATNVGKIISAYDHDDQGDWNHDDFVIDALLSPGGSGSPVLAVSCKTGEFELVGIYHARYNAAAGLNVVVAIDQVRDLMTKLERPQRPADAPELDAAARTRLLARLGEHREPPLFAFGSLVASVDARSDGTLVFAVYGSDFPRDTTPALAIEDVPASDQQFGKLGATYFGAAGGLTAYALADSDAETQAQIAHALALLRHDAVDELALRDLTRAPPASRDAFARVAKQKRALTRALDAQHDDVQAVTDMVARVAPHASGAATTLASLCGR
jgi:S1-C subfamily serine protease